MWISIDTGNRRLYSCGLKFRWALMSMPSSTSSLNSNPFLPASELFPLQTPGSINIKIFRNHYFQKKSAKCIIFSAFNNTLHSDLPSQIIHLPTRIPHSETSYVTLRNLPQRHCKQKKAFWKSVPVNVHEISFLSQCRRKHELNKDLHPALKMINHDELNYREWKQLTCIEYYRV